MQDEIGSGTLPGEDTERGHIDVVDPYLQRLQRGAARIFRFLSLVRSVWSIRSVNKLDVVRCILKMYLQRQRFAQVHLPPSVDRVWSHQHDGRFLAEWPLTEYRIVMEQAACQVEQHSSEGDSSERCKQNGTLGVPSTFKPDDKGTPAFRRQTCRLCTWLRGSGKTENTFISLCNVIPRYEARHPEGA